MAVDCSISVIAEVTGLGKTLTFPEKFSVTATVTKAAINRQIQTTTAEAEALNLCGISTVELIVIKATSNDLLVDTDFVDSFDSDEVIPEGEVRIIKPAGTVYIRNEDDDEVCTVDYLIVGSA